MLVCCVPAFVECACALGDGAYDVGMRERSWSCSNCTPLALSSGHYKKIFPADESKKGIVNKADWVCLVNIQWGVNIRLIVWVSKHLCIMDHRVFGQMRRHHTLTLILLIHLPPLCLRVKVCVPMEVLYHCQGAGWDLHRVLCWNISPWHWYCVAFYRCEKDWQKRSMKVEERSKSKAINNNFKGRKVRRKYWI